MCELGLLDKYLRWMIVDVCVNFELLIPFKHFLRFWLIFFDCNIIIEFDRLVYLRLFPYSYWQKNNHTFEAYFLMKTNKIKTHKHWSKNTLNNFSIFLLIKQNLNFNWGAIFVHRFFIVLVRKSAQGLILILFFFLENL